MNNQSHFKKLVFLVIISNLFLYKIAMAGSYSTLAGSEDSYYPVNLKVFSSGEAAELSETKVGDLCCEKNGKNLLKKLNGVYVPNSALTPKVHNHKL